jgi:hypothetical protein
LFSFDFVTHVILVLVSQFMVMAFIVLLQGVLLGEDEWRRRMALYEQVPPSRGILRYVWMYPYRMIEMGKHFPLVGVTFFVLPIISMLSVGPMVAIAAFFANIYLDWFAGRDKKRGSP